MEENRQHIVKKSEDIENDMYPVPEYHDPDYIPPTDTEGYIPSEEQVDVPEVVKEQNYIMGKSSRAKEKLVTSTVRETKSGKGMIIFDLYDGTGTITCKSFGKNYEEGQKIEEKMKNAQAIKAIGKAQLDNYAGDVTVMVNTIIEGRRRNTINIRKHAKHYRANSKSRRLRSR